MTDASKLDDYRTQITREWDDPATIAAWRKWRTSGPSWSQGVTDAIVAAVQARPGLHILDLASGAGQPAISLARAVAPDGRVTAADMSPGMLGVAQEFAGRERVSNITFRQADGENLPFRDEEFDGVTCRFGVMFFPDPVRALRECRRVLKPGGRAAFIAWGTPDQPLFTSTVEVLRKHVDMPRPAPDAPQPFRFEQPASLRAVLRDAGFTQVCAETQSIPAAWPGPPEQFWQERRECGAPWRKVLNDLSPAVRSRVDEEVLAAVSQFYDGRQVRLHLQVVLATGVRAER